jgi:hypothetical protein
MALGFRHAFKAGISFGKDDMVIPAKESHVDETKRVAVRAAVSGRPDHPGREVQQGDRRLVEVHDKVAERDDGRASVRRAGDRGDGREKARSTRST